MSFSKYEVLNFLIIRYTDPSLVPKHTLFILSETRGHAFHYIFPDILELFVLFMTLSYILR
jgi:hypothetical protein